MRRQRDVEMRALHCFDVGDRDYRSQRFVMSREPQRLRSARRIIVYLPRITDLRSGSATGKKRQARTNEDRSHVPSSLGYTARIFRALLGIVFGYYPSACLYYFCVRLKVASPLPVCVKVDYIFRQTEVFVDVYPGMSTQHPLACFTGKTIETK